MLAHALKPCNTWPDGLFFTPIFTPIEKIYAILYANTEGKQGFKKGQGKPCMLWK